jgi:hypothetical protein
MEALETIDSVSIASDTNTCELYFKERGPSGSGTN